MNNISSPQYYSEPITIFEASRDGQYLAQLKGGRALILESFADHYGSGNIGCAASIQSCTGSFHLDLAAQEIKNFCDEC